MASSLPKKTFLPLLLLILFAILSSFTVQGDARAVVLPNHHRHHRMTMASEELRCRGGRNGGRSRGRGRGTGRGRRGSPPPLVPSPPPPSPQVVMPHPPPPSSRPIFLPPLVPSPPPPCAITPPPSLPMFPPPLVPSPPPPYIIKLPPHFPIFPSPLVPSPPPPPTMKPTPSFPKFPPPLVPSPPPGSDFISRQESKDGSSFVRPVSDQLALPLSPLLPFGAPTSFLPPTTPDRN